MFDFEKMQVYQLSLELIDIATRITSRFPRGYSDLADQLRRAVTSSSLNISEGSGEFQPKEKARFYRMSLRSVSESCSVIQIAHRLKIAGDMDYAEGYATCTLLSKMLTNLVKSMNARAVKCEGQGPGRGTGNGNRGSDTS